ncbi:MAG: hypothetical protein ACOY45_15665 [Pseudomonadota bacterium]
MSYPDALAADARFVILRELTQQVDGRLNQLSIRRLLDDYSIRRDPDWIVTQLRKLEMLGAIELIQGGAILVARLTPLGRHHVDERAVIEGVTRPADFG